MTTRESESIARVPCGPPPCTIATRRLDGCGRLGAVGCNRRRRSRRTRLPPAGRWRRAIGSLVLRPRVRANCGTNGEGPDEREPDLEDHPGQQDHATESHHAGERAVGLADRQGCQRHAAEREHQTQRLGQGVRGGPADHTPRALRRDRCCNCVEAGEDRCRSEVSGNRQRPHPGHRRIHPGGREQPTARAHARGATVSPSTISNIGIADERQRPDAPWWHRQRNAEPGDDRRPRPRTRNAEVESTSASDDSRRGRGAGTPG